MEAPQIAMIVLYSLNLGIALVEHGKPKKGTNSFWVTLVGMSIGAGILYWGGFWN